MELYERVEELKVLSAALDAADDSRGSVVFISGEAGIGKTSLIREFTNTLGNDGRVLWGACDDLSTPRTLGPFRDIAGELGGALREMLIAGKPPSELFDVVMDALDAGMRPTVTVIEDAHWGDSATFDMLKFLGRRIGRRSVVLIVTYRDEEITADHSLRLVAGDLASDAVHRLTLAPLSKSAIESMGADYSRSPEELYAATGGNPFLVTEALAHPDSALTDSVRDSVVVRLSRLSAAAREVAEITSVVPGQFERWLLEEVLDVSTETLVECHRRGLIEFDDRAVWYRHELVRAAAEESLSPDQRVTFNEGIMQVLIEREGDMARIVHHARMANHSAALARFAPEAGRQASTAASHREAVSHLSLAIEHIDLLEEEDQARLLRDLAVECYFTNQTAEALAAAQRALEKWRILGDVEREGEMLRWLSRLHWWLGDAEEAERAGIGAVETLEVIAPSPELAMAYSNLAQLHMLSQRFDPTVHWATKAIDAARELDDHATLAHALNNLGSARARVGDLAGVALLEESLMLSVRERLDDHAGRAFANLIWTALDNHDYDTAERHLKDGLAYAEERELGGSLYYLRAERARLRFERGDWARAEEDARWVLGRPEATGITQMPALATLAKLEVRRGDRGAAETLKAAWQLARPTGELQRIAPVATARAELAWLSGRTGNIADAVAEAYELAKEATQPWVTDELAFWLWRSGIDTKDLNGDTPYISQMQGRWEAAAASWEHLGCPYEAAMARGDSAEPKPLLKALEVFDTLGATPAAARVRRMLRDLGVQGVPRGPRRETRANPAGLTPRQVDVLKLLVQGFTNAEIAEALFVSPKTVDHHVSAVLTKLGVASRREAAMMGRGMDLG
jgi:DNA-binding CsgD family transcriptional regulator/tetratricopeptide (TPR) repeat protein